MDTTFFESLRVLNLISSRLASGQLAAFVFIVLCPAAFGQPLPRHVTTFADGCVRTQASCNSTVIGQLAAGDCSDQFGYYDVVEINGKANDQVTATLYAFEPSFTDVTLGLNPPAGDGSVPPYTGAAGGTASLKYQLSSTGAWHLVVYSGNALSHGHYAMQISCSAAAPSPNQNCIAQQILCGQSSDWAVSPASCKFGSAPSVGYSPYFIELEAGDTIRVTLTSNDFDPVVAIYSSPTSLAASAGGKRFSSTGAVLTYTATVRGSYLLVATPNTDGVLGGFVLGVTCLTGSHCHAPTISSQQTDVKAQKGDFVTLLSGVVGSSPLLVEWFEGAVGDFSHPLSTSNSFFMIADTPRVLWAKAANNCGIVDTRTIAVSIEPPPAPPRRRAAKH